MGQWLRIRLPMQETGVRALVREDPTCCRARVLQLLSLCATATEARVPRACAPQQEKPAHRNEESPPLTATRESLRAATKTQCNQK